MTTKLGRMRERLGLSQEQAARRIQIQRVQLSRIENLHTAPSLRVLVGMARVYRIRLDRLQRIVFPTPRRRSAA